MLWGLGSVVSPRRGGGRGKVAGHGKVVDVGPFGESRPRLLVAKGATCGKGEGSRAEFLVGLRALEELGGHVAVASPKRRDN